jgi:hypothetical protein
MGIRKQSTRVTFTTSAGVWKKVFASPTADRIGVGLFVSPDSALDVFVRFLPLGSSAPSSFAVGDADEIVYKTVTREWNESARDNMEIWVCGSDGSGGACTYSAWEVTP